MTTTATPRPATRTHRSRRGWWTAAGLILLSLVPMLAGAMRLTELASAGPVTADNARFFDSPVPVIAHIISVTIYCLLGAFQFVPALRRTRWHRTAGRILIPAGLVSALSGLWMAVFYVIPGDETLLLVIRVVVGVAMVAAIVAGIASIRRRNFAAHGAWMTRAYALGVGAGTQAVVLTAWSLAVGAPDPTTNALLMGASWALNIVVAEIAIRNPRRAGGR